MHHSRTREVSSFSSESYGYAKELRQKNIDWKDRSYWDIPKQSRLPRVINLPILMASHSLISVVKWLSFFNPRKKDTFVKKLIKSESVIDFCLCDLTICNESSIFHVENDTEFITGAPNVDHMPGCFILLVSKPEQTLKQCWNKVKPVEIVFNPPLKWPYKENIRTSSKFFVWNLSIAECFISGL